MSLLPLVVIGAAILFFVLKATGTLDMLADLGKDSQETKKRWGQKLIESAKADPDLNERLEVFKDFLERQEGPEDTSNQD
ncbi:MAG: hypothetical protein PVF85_12500 [Anaerolineales bacterium]